MRSGVMWRIGVPCRIGIGVLQVGISQFSGRDLAESKSDIGHRASEFKHRSSNKGAVYYTSRSITARSFRYIVTYLGFLSLTESPDRSDRNTCDPCRLMHEKGQVQPKHSCEDSSLQSCHTDFQRVCINPTRC